MREWKAVFRVRMGTYNVRVIERLEASSSIEALNKAREIAASNKWSIIAIEEIFNNSSKARNNLP